MGKPESRPSRCRRLEECSLGTQEYDTYVARIVRAETTLRTVRTGALDGQYTRSRGKAYVAPQGLVTYSRICFQSKLHQGEEIGYRRDEVVKALLAEFVVGSEPGGKTK